MPGRAVGAQQTLPEQRPETHAALLLFAHVPPVATRHAPSLALHCWEAHALELLQHLPPAQEPEMHGAVLLPAVHVVPALRRQVPEESQCPDGHVAAVQQKPVPQRPEVHAALFAHVLPGTTRQLPDASHCPDAQVEAQHLLL